MTWYCVINIETRRILYLGDNRDRAVSRLGSAEWYSIGDTREAAKVNAEDEVQTRFGDDMSARWHDDPTPEQIKKLTAEIRSEWDSETQYKRMRGVVE